MARTDQTILVALDPNDRRLLQRVARAVEKIANSGEAAHRELLRSAVTGEFVSQAEADENPDTTIKEKR